MHIDLETDRRIAEFKVGIWSVSGIDAMHKRVLFHDLLNLAAGHVRPQR